MIQKPIADTLRQWRAARGLSQRALAERAGVGYVLIARLELGQTDPRLSTLAKLAEALRIGTADLLVGPTPKGMPKGEVRRGRRARG